MLMLYHSFAFGKTDRFVRNKHKAKSPGSRARRKNVIREENSSYERALFLPLARKPGDLAVCLYYNILLLFERRIDLYEISKRLKPRVHELDTDLD